MQTEKSHLESDSCSLAEHAMRLVKHDLISGVLRPGAKLGIRELVSHYGVGATPIREALLRMEQSGMVIPMGNRGFRASEVSYEDLLDITRTRQLVETDALRRSMRSGGVDWETGIVSSLYQLKRKAEQPLRKDFEGEVEFDAAHKAFHRALIAACGSPRLLHLHDNLYDQACRYRFIVMRKVRRTSGFYEEHQELADNILARDAEIACKMLSDHLGLTLQWSYPQNKVNRNTKS